MEPLTELQARLSANGAEGLRADILERMTALETRLRNLMAQRLQTKAEFARLTILAYASDTAQKVIADAAWADSPSQMQTIHTSKE